MELENAPGADPAKQRRKVKSSRAKGPGSLRGRAAMKKKNSRPPHPLDDLLRSLDALEKGLQGALEGIQVIRDIRREPQGKPEKLVRADRDGPAKRGKL